MAAALSLTFGRGGALVGNLLFGFLIDLNCVVPIVLFAIMLLGKKKYIITLEKDYAVYLQVVDFSVYCFPILDKDH